MTLKLTPDRAGVFARRRDPMVPLIVSDTVQSPEEARPTIEVPPLLANDAPDRVIEDETTEANDAERRTILGMPPLVPPRKDTVKMPPIKVEMLRITRSAPRAIIDENAERIRLPWRPRVRAWMAWLWRRLTAPATRRAPQAR